MLFSAKVGVAGLVVALAAGLIAPAAVASPSDDRRAAVAKPTLKASRATVLSGNRLVLAGRVTPVRKGTTVVLQKLTAGKKKWANEARLKAGKGGVFRYADKPRTAGVRHYRVVVPKTGTTKQRASSPVKVTVYRWVSLKDVAVRSTTGTHLIRPVLMNGVKYAPSYVGRSYDTSGFVDWNLSRACLRLEARLGNSDNSDVAATAAVSLVTDGRTAYAQAFGLAESEATTVDISGILRLGFHWKVTGPDGEARTGGAATLAEPRVLCSF